MLKVQAPFQSTSAHWIHECQTNPRASNEYTNAHRIHKGIQIYKCSSSKKGNLTFLKYPYILKYTYTHTHHMYIYKHTHTYTNKHIHTHKLNHIQPHLQDNCLSILICLDICSSTNKYLCIATSSRLPRALVSLSFITINVWTSNFLFDT